MAFEFMGYALHYKFLTRGRAIFLTFYAAW